MISPETEFPQHALESRVAAAGLTLAILIGFAPLLLCSEPVLLDYQNHLARVSLIADNIPPNRYYVVDWRNISNELGVDFIAVTLKGFVSSSCIGRICLILAFALPPAGVILLGLRLHGRLSTYHILVPFFAWTLTGLAGFLNFQIGLGLALIAAAADPILGTTIWVKVAGRVLAGLIILLDHGLALTFYIILLIGLHLDFSCRPISLYSLKRNAIAALAAGATGLLPVLIVVLLTHTVPGDRDPARYGGVMSWNTHRTMLMSLVSPLSTYNARVDVLIALLLSCFLMGSVACGKVSFHSGLLLVAAGLYALSIFMPRGTPYGGWTDRRLPIMALLTVLASAQITFPTVQRSIIFGVLAFAMVILRTSWIGWNWVGGGAMEDSTISALSAMASGAKVLAVQHVPSRAEISAAPAGRFLYGNEITYRHLPTSAVRLKQAFVPTLFTQQGVHPVHVKAAWLHISNPEGGDLPPISALRDERQINAGSTYLRAWRAQFDYVLVLNADYPDASGSNDLPAGLRLVSDQGFAQLFRVVRSGE